jgi:hypothetical protein
MSETKKLKTKDGTIVYYLDGKMHNFDGPAYLPQGNKRAAEYYVFGVKFTKEQFDNIKKDNNGVPFYKTAAGKAAGARV